MIEKVSIGLFLLPSRTKKVTAAKEERLYDPHKMAFLDSLACVASSELYTIDLEIPDRKWNE
jgi:hypothetical protein